MQQSKNTLLQCEGKFMLQESTNISMQCSSTTKLKNILAWFKNLVKFWFSYICSACLCKKRWPHSHFLLHDQVSKTLTVTYNTVHQHNDMSCSWKTLHFSWDFRFNQKNIVFPNYFTFLKKPMKRMKSFFFFSL